MAQLQGAQSAKLHNRRPLRGPLLCREAAPEVSLPRVAHIQWLIHMGHESLVILAQNT